MLKSAILKGADAHDALTAFDENERAKYMNASEALTCIRKQWYQKNGAEPDGPENWGYARRGKHIEDYVVRCLRLANVPMLFTGDEQVQIVDEDTRSSCTPDGLVDWDQAGEWWAAEFKSIDPRTNLSNLPREEHVRQVQIAAAMFEKHRADFPEMGDLPLVGCVLVYVNASDYNDIHEYRVPLKHKILDQLAPRARRLLDAKGPSRLPREGKQKNGGRECKQRCNFCRVCGVDAAATTTGQGRKGAGNLGELVGSYLSLKTVEDNAKAERNKIAELIKAQLKKRGVTSEEVDGHPVALTTRKGSVAYAKVVRDHCPDVDLEPYRSMDSEVLTVK